MNIKYITCSDPRNYNAIYELFDLWDIDPRVEIAVQMHPGKVSPGTERYNWIKDLFHALYGYDENLAIHVNNDWCDEICNGKIPDALRTFFNATNDHCKPIVKRIQLNMPQKTAENFDAQKLKKVIDYYNEYHDKQFIIQYNVRTKNAVEQLHKAGANFSLLFDESGGTGRDAGTWRAPVYPYYHYQGYSGGMSPENVADNLTKISRVAGAHAIWIDAEGKLKRDDKFDVNRAKQYIQNALRWDKKQR
jgi:phosphoribosylanthranilate isomerase